MRLSRIDPSAYKFHLDAISLVKWKAKFRSSKWLPFWKKLFLEVCVAEVINWNSACKRIEKKYLICMSTRCSPWWDFNQTPPKSCSWLGLNVVPHSHPCQTCIAQLYQQSYQLRVSGSKNFHPCKVFPAGLRIRVTWDIQEKIKFNNVCTGNPCRLGNSKGSQAKRGIY